LALALSAGLEADVFDITDGIREARAEFSSDGATLTVRLSNLGEPASQNNQVLTSVFFNLAISGWTGSFSPTGVYIPTGGSVVNGAPSPAFDACGTFGTPVSGCVGGVGGEFAFKSGIATPPAGGGSYGLSSSGLGIFGPGDRFPGNNLQGPDSPDGPQYGLVNGVTAGNSINDAQINNSVIFLLAINTTTGVFPTFTASGGGSNFSNVVFQYGTALGSPDEPCLGCTQFAPETSTSTLLASGLLLLLLSNLLKRRRRA
jgi:hypothetical protein